MFELKRTQVDRFEIKDALPFEEIEAHKDNIEKYLIKMEEVFKDFPKINLAQNKKDLFLNGVKLKGFEKYEEGTYNIYINNSYIGTGIVYNGYLKRDIIID